MKSIRAFVVALALLFLAPVSVHADLLFAVNEGTSSSMDAMFRQDKYADLAKFLSGRVGQKVKIETSNILPILVRNIGKQRYDVLLVRPSHLSAQAIRDHGYRLLVVAKGEAKLHFIVRNDSPLKNLADVHGHSIAFPDRLAYPTQLGQAMLRDAGIDLGKEEVHYMDRQEAVGYTVAEKLVDVGVVISYSKVGKEWLKSGGRFLASKDKLPFWSVVVSQKVAPDTALKLKQALIGLETNPAGQELLSKIGVSGFAEGQEQAYLDMLSWVEGPTGKPQARK